MFADILGCSTISFRHLPLSSALSAIRGLGFQEADLGALPGVCEHIPIELDSSAVGTAMRTVRESGVRIRSVNGDIGDLNVPVEAAERDSRDSRLKRLLEVCRGVGAPGLVLPCGALSSDPIRSLDEDLDLVAAELERAAETASHQGIEIWCEALHFYRLCNSLARAEQLACRLKHVGIVMDFSHIVAAGDDPRDFIASLGDRISHVHLRDAVKGDINRSLGNGDVDFGSGLSMLMAMGYSGRFSLELETRDVSDEQRPDAAASAAALVTPLIGR